MLLMLTHPREEIKESMAGGDLLRMRLAVPPHLVGKHVSDLSVEGKILVAGVDRGGSGFIPVPSSTFQDGDVVHIIMHRDEMALLDELMRPIGEH